jgi:anthranilate phosphoribosyltransferase
VPATGLLDTCGTGGDCANTVNVSTAAATTIAACGVPVAKHGNRAASGNSGSAEVLAELGIAIDAGPPVVGRCLAETGITFLFAPKYHPGLKRLAPVRRQLPFRTVMNLVGPLANPARPEFQLVGVAGEAQARLVAGALARLGVRRAAVVTGADGLDEVSLSGPTRVLVVEDGAVQEGRWVPDDFGLGRTSVAELHVCGPSDSAARICHLLAGEPGPVRDTVLANAAAALWVVEPVELSAAVARAAEAVDSGRAARVLDRWREVSREPAVKDLPAVG